MQTAHTETNDGPNASAIQSKLSKQGIAAYLNVTERTIDNWRSERGFPTITIGKVIRFDRSAVDQWLENFQASA